MLRIFVVLFLFSNLVLGQTESEIKYFKDKYAITEVENGPYKLVIKKLNDSVTTHIFTKAKKGQKVWTKSFLREQPYGIWTQYDKRGNIESTRDYNFVLKYGEYIPDNAIKVSELKSSPLTNPNNKKIQQHIVKHFRYPEIAQENGVQGKVTVQFTVDKSGKVGNLRILEGTHISLDTECFAIMNSLKELEPYTKDGQKILAYITMPITFKLQ